MSTGMIDALIQFKMNCEKWNVPCEAFHLTREQFDIVVEEFKGQVISSEQEFTNPTLMGVPIKFVD